MQHLRLLSLLGSLAPLCLWGASAWPTAQGAAPAVPPVVVYEQGAGGPPLYPYSIAPPFLTTAYAETAMPATKGRKSVFFGAALLLLLLALTEWRVEDRRLPADSWKSRVKIAQDVTAEAVNRPFLELNKRLEAHGKALSARLVLFMSALVFLVLGTGEVLLSVRQRHNYKKVFPVLQRASSLKFSSILSLLIAAAAFYGLVIAWPHVGASLTV
ncbi:hypothetical protein ACSSS7_005277 [Eimeria intestinalis]